MGESDGERAIPVDGAWNSGACLHRRALRWLLDFPLFYKILVANSALVLTMTLLGAWLASRHVAGSEGHLVHWEFGLWFGGVALAAVLAVNYLLLRAALQPLEPLTRLVGALQRGDVGARAEPPVFGDPAVNRLIGTANVLLDELEGYRRRVRLLSERATEQLETERENIARELHDDTAQYLATLLVVQQMVAEADDEEKRSRSLEEARQLTRLALAGVRRMSMGLRPRMLDEVGVPGALRWYVEELLEGVLPRTDMELDEGVDRLPAVAELALYRIAQEALSNVSRHARAASVRVELGREGAEVVLRVSDDGQGFHTEAAVPGDRRGHLGLFTMQERARLAGGRAEISSRPGEGTTVTARVPAGPDGAPSGAVR